MDLSKLVAVSGMPGLYRMVANKNNGLIVEQLETGKRTFASARKHQFTPLESIAIFTDDGDSVPFKEVLQRIKALESELPVPSANEPADVLREWFTRVLPNHDRSRVYNGDIKKIIKWYALLDAQGLIVAAEEEEE